MDYMSHYLCVQCRDQTRLARRQYLQLKPAEVDSQQKIYVYTNLGLVSLRIKPFLTMFRQQNVWTLKVGY